MRGGPSFRGMSVRAALPETGHKCKELQLPGPLVLRGAARPDLSRALQEQKRKEAAQLVLRCACAVAAAAAREEIGADEFVEVAVEYAIYVTLLDFGPVIFDKLIGLQNVRANLAAETDFRLGFVELARDFAAFVNFAFVKLGLQHLHGDFAILVLAAFVLALDDDARRKMRDADSGFDFVDVLSAMAARAKRIDTKFVGLDDDVDAVVNFRDDKHRGKGSMTAGGLVEWRNAHKAVHSGFPLQ